MCEIDFLEIFWNLNRIAFVLFQNICDTKSQLPIERKSAKLSKKLEKVNLDEKERKTSNKQTIKPETKLFPGKQLSKCAVKQGYKTIEE